MQQTIYLMRHGQTFFNQQHRIQGWSDSPLTEIGKNQARIASKYFSSGNIELESAYSSTSERASDTLELVTDLPYKRLKGIKEWNFGTFEAEHDYLYPYGHDSEFFAEFGGETDLEVQRRMSKTITEIVKNDLSENILIVSHGGAIRSFARAWAKYGESQEYLPYENCCILKYYYRDGIFIFQSMFNSDFSSLDK